MNRRDRRARGAVAIHTANHAMRFGDVRLEVLEMTTGVDKPCVVFAPDGIPYHLKPQVRAMLADAARGAPALPRLAEVVPGTGRPEASGGTPVASSTAGAVPTLRPPSSAR